VLPTVTDVSAARDAAVLGVWADLVAEANTGAGA
jgi:hypothetical protein